jgi:Fe-S cluster assembly scaffold protein SufB
MSTKLIEETAQQEYRWGISAKKKRARVAARVAPQGLPPLADDDRADVAEGALPADRLPGHHLLLRAQAEEDGPKSLDEVDPELLAPTRSSASRCTSEAPRRRGGRRGVRQRLGGHHLQGQAAEAGVIFCSFSEAVREHPELVKKYLGSVVPVHGQLLRGAQLRGVLQRRLVRLHPQGRALPDGAVDLLPHQREEHRPVRAHLIIADEGAYVSYLEGCTAPMRDENQLHAAVVELVALDDAPRSSTRPCRTGIRATKNGKGGIYNFVTKRGDCRGALEDLLDPGRDRLGHHLEVPELHPARATTRSASSTRWR